MTLAGINRLDWKITYTYHSTSVWGVAVGAELALLPNCISKCTWSFSTSRVPLVQNTDVTLDAGMRTTLTTGQVNQVYFSVDHSLDLIRPPYEKTSAQMYSYPRISCDKAVYYKDSGCVFAGAKSVLIYSLSSAAHKQVAIHVRDAQNSLSTHPGRLTNWTRNGTPLHRTTVTSIKNANTAAKNAACAKLTRPTGYQCDEYPFASTKEGGNTGIFSVRMVIDKQNSSAGGTLGVLYDLGRVGNNGEFWVQIVP